MKILAMTVLVLLPALILAGLARSVYRRGAFTEITRWWRGASRPMKVISILFASIAICYGGNKFLAGAIDLMMKKAGRFVGSVITNAFSAVEQKTGYALLVREGEEHEITMPENARLADRIARRGAHNDGFWHFDSFTNTVFREGIVRENPVWVHTDGTVTINSPSYCVPIDMLPSIQDTGQVTVYAPMQGSYGFLPEGIWERYGVSRIWMAITDYDSRIVTWDGAMPLRLTGNPVTFQAEFMQGGDVIYRYNGIPTNKVTVGLYRNGVVQTVDITTNTTSVLLRYIGDLGDGTGDADGDGLPDALETRIGSDPRAPDSDFDGLFDSAERLAGSNPLVRDTDGDGLVDGSDPDPNNATSLADGDDDGVPDAYEEYWFGGTDSVNTATNRDETGFTLVAKMLAGINPLTPPEAPLSVSTNRFISWKLFDAFAADWPTNGTDIVWERTVAVRRSSAWQQFCISAAPDKAFPWRLRGMILEWETDTGASGSLASSPLGDSFRIPLAPCDFPSSLTLRLRGTPGYILAPSSLHLIAYVPQFSITGGEKITGASGVEYTVFTEGTSSSIGVDIDWSDSPCGAPQGDYEAGLREIEDILADYGFIEYSGDERGGTVYVRRPGVYSFPSFAFGSPTSPRAPRPGAAEGAADGADPVFFVFAPSAEWKCAHHGCRYDGLGYDWTNNCYFAEDYYPLDTRCLRKKWYRHWDGSLDFSNCRLEVDSGIPEGNDLVTSESEGDTGRLFLDGVEVWSGSAFHTSGYSFCGGYYYENFLGDECEGCDADCSDGNCDSLEGASLGSLKFRIPLGSPAKGQVAGFVWFSSEGPVAVSSASFRLLAHPDANVEETAMQNARRVICRDSRGRDLLLEDFPNGARITIHKIADLSLEHIWEITNEDGDASRIRLRKISRLGNVMSDETYSCAENGNWTRFDNIAGIGTRLEQSADFAEYGEGHKRETRTTVDRNGRVLSSVSSDHARVGEGRGAVLREVRRIEDSGTNRRETFAEYWNDPVHRDRNGQPRLVRSNFRPWVYTDFDELGREILRVEQRGGSDLPAHFPQVVSGELRNAGYLADAFVTVSGYEPHVGDSCDREDAARPRTVTSYVVTNGVATMTGRSWHRCTRLVRHGYPAVKEGTWRAVSFAGCTSRLFPGNAYSYEVAFDETEPGIPLLMRGAPAESLDEEGMITDYSYSVTNGTMTCSSRQSFRFENLLTPLPTYEETVYDSAYGTLLRRSTLLAEDDTVLSYEESAYDDQNRMRYTSYSDGTSRTNAYSCCRLLWSRDREGRKVLRSARTGSDHLYSAEEDIWLADISEDGRFRVTQHFSDGLGRETNTVVYAASVQGEAVDPVVPTDDAMASRTIVEYPRGGSDYVIRTDERGKVTETETRLIPGGTETTERVLTNGVEVVKTTSRSYFGGGSTCRREWDGSWTEETRFTEYSPDGMRMEYTVASASDSPAFTNSVTAYDMLGRMVWRETPLTLEEYEYEGTSSRVSSVAEKKSGIVTRYRYNEFGEEAAVVRDGVESVQETSYVREDGQCWRRSRSAVVADGVVATSTTVSERLTGLSYSLRSMSVTVTDGVTNSVEKTWFNVAESVKVSESVSPVYGTNVYYSVYGISPKSSSPEGLSYAIHDAFGRVERTFRSMPGSDERIPVGWTVRNAAGDVVCEESYTNETATVRDLHSYDMLGNRTETVNSLGDAEFRRYYAMGMVSATGGTTYPVKYSYDTKGRRTSLATTRDGTTQDTTSWTFDPLTGLCTSKRYQDGASVAYSYTRDGLLLRTEYAGGRWKEKQYNSRRHVVGVTYSDGERNSFAYDSFSRKTAESNANSCVEYHRNLKGLPTNEVITVGTQVRTIPREYDGFGRLVRNDGTYYTYAADGRLDAVSNEIATVRYTYSPDRMNAGYTVALSSGTLIERSLVRDAYRRSLVMGISSAANGVQMQRLDYGYDVLDRPVSRNSDAFGYNRRSEVTNACISGSATAYGYDEIGNSSMYTANCLNQYTDFTYDADGNMLTDGLFSFAYDGAGRLKSVSSNGVVIVASDYDSKSRRVRKTTPEYEAVYFYDDWNLIEERVAWTNGESTVFRYYWGKDISESLQGAGGVGGLLYLTVEGAVYVPCYDNNGNITCYLDGAGSIVAEYVYDAFGNTVSVAGPLAGLFRHRFSTKYLDSETGLYYYGYRFYHPQLMRWLNRDPIEEFDCANLYIFCHNAAVSRFDVKGMWNWTKEKAIEEVKAKILEMRGNGYNFAADALEHYLRNHSVNLDLSHYAHEIYNNKFWQESFFDSVVSELRKKDPEATNTPVEIGDIEHKTAFDSDLNNGKIENNFKEVFSHRFYPSQSGSLFYALFGSHYSYIGTASWCRRSTRTGVAVVGNTTVRTDLRIVCWDLLSYAGEYARGVFPSYSAARYLHDEHDYANNYIYLKWNEVGSWFKTEWQAPRYTGYILRKGE